MKYYTLIGQQEAGQPFEIVFGDFDRDVVEDERRDLNEEWAMLIIIVTAEDQASIDRRVGEINETGKLTFDEHLHAGGR